MNNKLELIKTPDGIIKDKHYKDVPATSISQDKPDVVSPSDSNFSKASEEFYKNSEYILQYKNGYAIGQYGSQEQRFEIYLKRLKDGIKEILTDELRNENQTTEDLATTYKLIDNSFDLLAEIVNNKKVKLNMKKLLVKTHGFINGYVDHAKIIED